MRRAKAGNASDTDIIIVRAWMLWPFARTGNTDEIIVQAWMLWSMCALVTWTQSSCSEHALRDETTANNGGFGTSSVKSTAVTESNDASRTAQTSVRPGNASSAEDFMVLVCHGLVGAEVKQAFWKL